MKAGIGWTAIALAAFMAAGPTRADDGGLTTEDIQTLTHELAFDPGTFFPESYTAPLITIRYTGDDYSYPVYSLAVRRGCTKQDVGEARKECWRNLVARMVRSPNPVPGDEVPTQPRWAGAAVFAALYEAEPTNRAELSQAIETYGLEWLEADVGRCNAAMAHLDTLDELTFAAEYILPDEQSLSIVLHADKIDFELGGYITRSKYFGYAKRGSPGEWADQFAKSLDACWTKSEATPPWLRAADEDDD